MHIEFAPDDYTPCPGHALYPRAKTGARSLTVARLTDWLNGISRAPPRSSHVAVLAQ